MDPWSPIEIPSLPPVTAPPASEVPTPSGLGVGGSAWREFATSNTDALVVGDGPAVWRVLTAVWPTLEKPRFWCHGRQQGLNLSMYREGTLILEGVDELQVSEQDLVLDWCTGTTARSRVIATASGQIVALVRNGGFSRRLFDLLSAQLVLL
jgi:hypothetical protein